MRQEEGAEKQLTKLDIACYDFYWKWGMLAPREMFKVSIRNPQTGFLVA
jgi:hypothetical protein